MVEEINKLMKEIFDGNVPIPEPETFTYYEKFHLHDFVEKKGACYTKSETDTLIDDTKTLISQNMKSKKNDILNQITQNDPIDPSLITQAVLENIKPLIIEKMEEQEQQIFKTIMKFRNQQVKNRVGRKSLTIPKTPYTWIPLLSASEIKGVTTLQDIIITNVYIRQNDRYHHAKSDLVAGVFNQLEFFFRNDFSTYECYFNSYPSDWSMECFVEYIVIPKEIKFEEFSDSDSEND